MLDSPKTICRISLSMLGPASRRPAIGKFRIGSALVVSIAVKPGEVNEPTLATLMPRLASY
jgi:hypothetical protein